MYLTNQVTTVAQLRYKEGSRYMRFTIPAGRNNLHLSSLHIRHKISMRADVAPGELMQFHNLYVTPFPETNSKNASRKIGRALAPKRKGPDRLPTLHFSRGKTVRFRGNLRGYPPASSALKDEKPWQDAQMTRDQMDVP